MTIWASLNPSVPTSVSTSWSAVSPWPSQPHNTLPQLQMQPTAVRTRVCLPPQHTITAGDPPNISLPSRAGRFRDSLSSCPSWPFCPLPQLHSRGVPLAVTQTVCARPAAMTASAIPTNAGINLNQIGRARVCESIPAKNISGDANLNQIGRVCESIPAKNISGDAYTS